MRTRRRDNRIGQRMLRGSKPRGGVVLVTVALALTVLLGIAGLTVDVGRTAVAVQCAQGVADAAAMAAANQLPDIALANARLTDVVSANNEANPWPQVTINTAEDVTYYAAGDEVPGYGVLESNEAAVTVQAHVNEQYGFARLSGLEQMNVLRPATAMVATADGPYPSLFAGEDTTWDTRITINGSDIRVEGDTHSNTRITINGSNQYFAGPVVYRNELRLNGSNIQLDGGSYEGAILDYPVDYTWDDFLPWDTEVSSISINGSGKSLDINGIMHVLGNVIVNGGNFHLSNGLLLVGGNVIFNGEGHYLENVTIIAKGSITFNGACQQLTPYTENLSLMSLKASSSTVITFNGSNNHNYGTFYAPNGGIVYNGSSQKHQYGSVIGKTITINGSNYSLYGTETSGGGTKTVQLIQ